jgi:hypothetical protein
MIGKVFITFPFVFGKKKWAWQRSDGFSCHCTLEHSLKYLYKRCISSFYQKQLNYDNTKLPKILATPIKISLHSLFSMLVRQFPSIWEVDFAGVNPITICIILEINHI